MFSSLTTKLALKKVGLPSDTFDLSSWTLPPADPQQPRREPNKLRKPMPEGYDPNNPDDSWGSWFSGGIGLPLTVHPWLSPAPPPVKVAAVPSVGDLAPVDREGRLRLGGGQRTLVVFLRCVGCACTFSLIPFLTAVANPSQSPRRPSSPSGPSRTATPARSAASPSPTPPPRPRANGSTSSAAPGPSRSSSTRTVPCMPPGGSGSAASGTSSTRPRRSRAGRRRAGSGSRSPRAYRSRTRAV